MTVILNGKASNTKPEDIIAVNGRRAIELPPTLNGYVPTDIAIDGYNRPPVLPGCVLYLPLWHSKLSRPSSIYSMDRYEHACTVTGASWRPNGRYFDGLDDRIRLPNLGIASGGFSIGFWIYPMSTGVTKCCAQVDPGLFFLTDLGDFYGNYDGIFYVSGSVAHDAWTSLLYKFDGTKEYWYRNGAWSSEHETIVPTLNATMYLGRTITNLYPFKGTQGEWVFYNRALSAAEISRIYNATKWRYN